MKMKMGKIWVMVPLMGLLIAGSVKADTMSWTNAAGGDWTNTSNWSNSVPGALDAALFDLDSATAYTVTNVPSGTVNQRLTVVKDKVTLDLTGTDYTLTDSEALYIGAVANADAHLEIVGGNVRMESKFINVAYEWLETYETQGTLVLDGVLVNWPADTGKYPVTQLRIGNWGGGAGNVTLSGGTVITQDRGINELRLYNSNSRLTITDPGTSIKIGKFKMGMAGPSNPSICVVSNGASLTTGQWDCDIGQSRPGVLTVTGSNTFVSLRAQANILYVGKSSQGLIQVLDGALVKDGLTWTDGVNDSYFGTGGSTRGSLRVEGTDSHYQIDKTDTSGTIVRFASNGSTLVVCDGGLVSQTQGSHLIFEAGSFLGGDGTLAIAVTNNGTIKPGGEMDNAGWYDVTSGAGTLTFTSDLLMGADSVCDIELAGTDAADYDCIAVSNDVALNGSIEVSMINGFTYNEALGNRFTVLEVGGTLSGAFANAGNGDWIADDTFQVHYGATSRFDANEVVLTTKPTGTVILVQ